TASRLNSSLYFIGMINILPATPLRAKRSWTKPNPQQTRSVRGPREPGASGAHDDRVAVRAWVLGRSAPGQGRCVLDREPSRASLERDQARQRRYAPDSRREGQSARRALGIVHDRRGWPEAADAAGQCPLPGTECQLGGRGVPPTATRHADNALAENWNAAL